MISDSSIERLKSQIDVVDIIGSVVELKKKGANYAASCPFHDEKTASFTVSPQKQIYHCFGCSAGGDAINFIQEYKKLTYPEAIEDIATYYNFTLEYSKESRTKNYDGIMTATVKYFKENITPDILEYLQERGVSLKSIAQFNIGYAPKGNVLIEHLKTNHFNLSDAIEVGLIAKESSRDRYYSRFSERIMFPIYSQSGKVVGFGGRTLKTDHSKVAKYLNSPGTKLFNKRSLFYGYNIAKERIHKKHTIIVTEGYLDVIMLHQTGISSSVATLGTALTESHIPLIKRTGAKTLLCYDGDRAGRDAAFKASVLLTQSNIDGGVVIFADGIDPADMVKSGQDKELITLLLNPINMIKYIINYITQKYNLEDAYAKQTAANEVNDYLQSIELLIANEYRQYVAQVLQIETRFVSHVQMQQVDARRHADSDISELMLMKTMIENGYLISDYLKVLKVDTLKSYTREFHLLIDGKKDDPSIRAIAIRDDIKTYNDAEFMKVLKFKQKQEMNMQLELLVKSLKPDEQKLMEIKELKMKLSTISVE